ncbi:MAG: type II toxin-antitoxin system RelE/ParE family toxin [Leptospiraceae bacterium]|nr:type II toxin-antitoxin system RelE/ParE family toxin [Leptospiraceae bacterium]MCP5498820.1 type II toxin-antitoxin system RelE/ParE family toxin [Leptospiraceae bacterium]
MIQEVIWLEKAKKDFKKTVEYVKENWGNSSAEKFTDKVEKEINLLKSMPKIRAIIDEEKNIRRSVIVKQISLYYMEIEIEKKLIIIRLLDNRQDPGKIGRALNVESLYIN